MKKNTVSSWSRSKGRETKYILLSCHQNAGQNHDINISKRRTENVVQFKYLGMTVTNQE
jgi:hypothetical protein